MDVNLLRMQKIRGLEIKAIKGTENPADLGTKALTKEKIRKYMVILGYETEEGEVETWNQRKKGKSVSGAMVQKIERIVTMVLMCEVGECKVEEKGTNRHVCSVMFMVAVTCGMVVFMCASAAFWLKAFDKGMPSPKSKPLEKMVRIEEVGNMALAKLMSVKGFYAEIEEGLRKVEKARVKGLEGKASEPTLESAPTTPAGEMDEEQKKARQAAKPLS